MRPARAPASRLASSPRRWRHRPRAGNSGYSSRPISPCRACRRRTHRCHRRGTAAVANRSPAPSCLPNRVSAPRSAPGRCPRASPGAPRAARPTPGSSHPSPAAGSACPDTGEVDAVLGAIEATRLPSGRSVQPRVLVQAPSPSRVSKPGAVFLRQRRCLSSGAATSSLSIRQLVDADWQALAGLSGAAASRESRCGQTSRRLRQRMKTGVAWVYPGGAKLGKLLHNYTMVRASSLALSQGDRSHAGRRERAERAISSTAKGRRSLRIC